MLLVSFTYDQPATLVDSYAWVNLAAQRPSDKQQQQAIATRESLEHRMDAASIARAQALADTLPACGQKNALAPAPACC